MAGILQRWFTKGLLKKFDRVSIPVTDLHDNVDYQMGAFELGQAAIAGNPNIGSIDRIYGVATNLDEGGDYNIDNLKEPGRYTWTTKVPGGINIEGRQSSQNQYGSLTVTKVGSGNDRKQVLNFGIDNTQYSRTNPGGNNPWGEFKNAELATTLKDGATFSPSGIKVAEDYKTARQLTKVGWYRIAEVSAHNGGDTAIVMLANNTQNYDNQSVVFAIGFGFYTTKPTFSQLLGTNYVKTIFDKIRVGTPKDTSKGLKRVIEFHYNFGAGSTVYTQVLNSAHLKMINLEEITSEKENLYNYKEVLTVASAMAYEGVAIPDVNNTITTKGSNYHLVSSGSYNDFEYGVTFIGVNDYNKLTEKPPLEDAYIVWTFNSNPVNDLFKKQIAFARSSVIQKIFVRSKRDTWTEWQELAITPIQTLQTYNKGITE